METLVLDNGAAAIKVGTAASTQPTYVILLIKGTTTQKKENYIVYCPMPFSEIDRETLLGIKLTNAPTSPLSTIPCRSNAYVSVYDKTKRY